MINILSNKKLLNFKVMVKTSFLTNFWYLVPLTFNIYYYFIEKPQWKTIGGFLLGMICSIIPILNMMTLGLRIFSSLIIIWDEGVVVLKKDSLILKRKVKTPYGFIKTGTNLVSWLDMVIVYPIGYLLPHLRKVLSIQLRK